jgi:DNA (cytosine-5)-methyltransferase 1
MVNLTSADLFSGAGGVAQGMKQAGFTHAWGLEFDSAIAEIYRANHGQVYVQNILDADPMKFEKVDLLHASPVCKSFSTANAKKGEKQLDIDCAIKTAEFIQVLQPPTFTLENVQAYGKSKAFNIILEMLYSQGYWVNYQVFNAADFSVPQSRRRLILIAVKSGFIPSLPPKEKHIGWYEAIVDKVHDLPDSDLAPWQWKALPNEIRNYLFLSQQYNNFEAGKNFYAVDRYDLSFTLTSTNSAHPLKAILLENTGARSDRPLQTKQSDEPCWTLRAMGQDGHYHRANALLIHPTEQRSDKPYKYADETCHTILANHGGENIKALLENAKIKALDIACLARLQSFPDDYKWSGKKSIDGKGIGNAVPPLLYEKVIRSVVNANS